MLQNWAERAGRLLLYTLNINPQVMGPAVLGELLPQQERSDGRLRGGGRAPTGVLAGVPEPPLCAIWQQCWLLPVYDDSAVKTLDLGGMDMDTGACLCCGLLPGKGLAASLRISSN